MARDQVGMNVEVYRDEDGVILVSFPESSNRLLSPTYLVELDGATQGPQALGSWLKFCPSNYRKIEPPYSPEVEETIAKFSLGGKVARRAGGRESR